MARVDPCGRRAAPQLPDLPPVFVLPNRTRTLRPLRSGVLSQASCFLGRLADRFSRSKTRLALHLRQSKVPLAVSGHRTGAAVERNKSIGDNIRHLVAAAAKNETLKST